MRDLANTLTMHPSVWSSGQKKPLAASLCLIYACICAMPVLHARLNSKLLLKGGRHA